MLAPSHFNQLLSEWGLSSDPTAFRVTAATKLESGSCINTAALPLVDDWGIYVLDIDHQIYVPNQDSVVFPGLELINSIAIWRDNLWCADHRGDWAITLYQRFVSPAAYQSLSTKQNDWVMVSGPIETNILPRVVFE